MIIVKRKPKANRLQRTFKSSDFIKSNFNEVLLNDTPTSTQLISASTQLSVTPSTIFKQDIARNWAISTDLCRKIKSCPFWLKIGIFGILKVFISNPDLDFWNSDPKIHFWGNFYLKIQSCLFCLKIGARNISMMLIPNPDLDFWNFDPKILFWANLCPKT